MSIDCTDSDPISHGAYQSFLLSTSPAAEQILSLNDEAQKEASNVKLYMQYALAGLAGVIPFSVAKIGEGIVKGTAFLVSHFRDFSIHLGAFGFVTELFFRAIAAIPTAIGGALLRGGAVIFSKSQALVWGQHLVEHPQEETVNTKLARYGASDKPWKDFRLVLETYFSPCSKDREVGNDRFDIDQNLRQLQTFEPA